MFIPKVLKIRTQTEKTPENIPLSYITYIDETGKLRKETSWKNWGKFLLDDSDNLPKTGFRLEKDVKRSKDWFGTGRTLFRIVHPLGITFEISSNNFSEIVLHCDLEKGEIKEPCVLAWDGKDLALIPTNTDEYLEHVKHTEMIEEGFLKSKELIIGKPYRNKNKGFEGWYVGKVPQLDIDRNFEYSNGSYYNRTVSKYIYNIKFKNLHTFISKSQYDFGKGIQFSYDRKDYSSPKVYNCEEDFVFGNVNNRLTEFDEIVLTDYDRLEKYFSSWGNIFIPERFKGELNKEEIEKFIKEKIEERYKDNETSNKVINIDWNSFPKRI